MRFSLLSVAVTYALIPLCVLAVPLHPALVPKDAMALHKRASVPPVSESDAEVESAEDQLEDACTEVCGTVRVEGAQSEREALCSTSGLRATLECATCIDMTWPDTEWEDSATAEYERIFSACHQDTQQLFGTKKTK
ncbi:hypothetical protein BCR39DRAFT_524931 [Naematelia encephala]|uniref:Uncharacterized protein n=1 Tax=Naematelia encephala TaxID=71784 RepID=A0A1Y2BAZ6_9TREE|nr:hypothetical protein BCR39DRAFT_524931 [Naematelia encephala]